MATKLDEHVFTKGRTGAYPWDEWLDGSIWKLEQGDDFTASTKSFRAAVYAAAKLRGLSVRTEVRDDSGTVIVQSREGADTNGTETNGSASLTVEAPARKPRPRKAKAS